jgi:hypothetical protein
MPAPMTTTSACASCLRGGYLMSRLFWFQALWSLRPGTCAHRRGGGLQKRPWWQSAGG